MGTEFTEFQRTIEMIEALTEGATEAELLETARGTIWAQWTAWGGFGAWRGLVLAAEERLLIREGELWAARDRAAELEREAEALAAAAETAQARCEAAATATARSGFGAIASNRRGQAAYARRAAESYRTGRMATYATRVRESTERRAARLAA